MAGLRDADHSASIAALRQHPRTRSWAQGARLAGFDRIDRLTDERAWIQISARRR